MPGLCAAALAFSVRLFCSMHRYGTAQRTLVTWSNLLECIHRYIRTNWFSKNYFCCFATQSIHIIIYCFRTFLGLSFGRLVCSPHMHMDFFFLSFSMCCEPTAYIGISIRAFSSTNISRVVVNSWKRAVSAHEQTPTKPTIKPGIKKKSSYFPHIRVGNIISIYTCEHGAYVMWENLLYEFTKRFSGVFFFCCCCCCYYRRRPEPEKFV